jgi:hypothetical protein
MKVAIRRISLASLGRMGCLLGTVAAFLPSLLCGLAGLGLAVAAGRWLEGWKSVPLAFLGREVTQFDFVQLLGLEKVLDALQILASISGPALFLAVLALSLVSGALLAAIVILVGLAYNLLAAASGGVIVEMTAVKKEPPQ